MEHRCAWRLWSFFDAQTVQCDFANRVMTAGRYLPRIGVRVSG
jgi:hypothetical protein